ncbi:MAG: hypothetical protein ACJ74O_00115 [Frankiaceae bacterium]
MLAATVTAACMIPASPASAASVSVSRDGMSSSMSFSWASSHSWNSGTLKVSDTKADGDSVKAQILDYANTEGTHSNNGGSGTTATFSNLGFNSSNYNITYIYLHGCVVISLYPDACTNGGKSYNPYA